VTVIFSDYDLWKTTPPDWSDPEPEWEDAEYALAVGLDDLDARCGAPLPSQQPEAVDG